MIDCRNEQRQQQQSIEYLVSIINLQNHLPPTMSSSLSNSPLPCSRHKCSINAPILRHVVSASPYLAHSTHANPPAGLWHLTTKRLRTKNLRPTRRCPGLSTTTSHALSGRTRIAAWQEGQRVLPPTWKLGERGRVGLDWRSRA